MEIGSIVGAALIVFFGALFTYVSAQTRGEVRDLRAEMRDLRAKMVVHRGHVEELVVALERKLTSRVERAEAGNDAIRSDITRLAVALLGPRAENA